MNSLSMIAASLIIGLSLIISAMIIASPQEKAYGMSATLQKQAMENLKSMQDLHHESSINWKERWDADTKKLREDLEKSRNAISEHSKRTSEIEASLIPSQRTIEELE